MNRRHAAILPAEMSAPALLVPGCRSAPPDWILIDGRMWVSRPGSGETEAPSGRELHVHLANRPEFEGSHRLDFSSPAESAVVDLLGLAIRARVSAAQESTLVRGERGAIALDHGGGEFRAWRSARTKTERTVLRLRRMISLIERRRAAAGRPFEAPPGTPGGASASPP